MNPLTARSLSLPLALALVACSAPPPDSAVDPEAGRVGVYDPRAVCVAYANGPLFRDWMAELTRRHAAAQAAGDTATARELEASAKAQQARFHEQAFSGADVDNLLAHVADRMPAMLAAAGVERLERIDAPRGQATSTVDVTTQLVDLFDPDARGRQWIAELRQVPLAR